MDWAGSAPGALETCRSDDGFRDAAIRGVPGAVGVGVEDDDSDCAGMAELGRWGLLLKVEVDAVAWCVGWRYGERDWVCEEGRKSSFAEKLLIRSKSSSALSTVFESNVATELAMELGPTRLAIAQGNGR